MAKNSRLDRARRDASKASQAKHEGRSGSTSTNERNDKLVREATAVRNSLEAVSESAALPTVGRREARRRTIYFERSFLLYCWLGLVALSIVGAIFSIASSSALKSLGFLIFSWVVITERDTICRPQVRRVAISDLIFSKIRERFRLNRRIVYESPPRGKSNEQ